MKNLSLEVSLAIKQASGGADIDVITPPFNRDIEIIDKEGYNSYTIPAGGGPVDITPKNFTEKTQLVLLPEYGDVNTGDPTWGRLEVVVTTGSTNTFEITDFGAFSLPAATTAIVVNNPDASNPVKLQVIDWHK